MFRFLVGSLLFIAALMCYSNSFHNGFTLDDHGYFNDSTMKSLKFVPYHFLLSKGSVFGFEKNNSKGHYRPLQRAVHTVFYVAFEDNPVPYHITSILFLCSAGFLIYLIVHSFLPQSKAAALWGGLFFVMHPLNSTFVNYIGSGIYLGQAALMLLCVWSAAQDKYMYRWWAVVFFLLAVLFHESAMFLPLYATVLVLALRVPVWPRVWPLWVALAAFLIFSLARTSVLDILLHNSPVTSMHMTWGEYLSTFGKVSFWYLARLFFPNDVVDIWGAPIIFSVFWIGFLLISVLGGAVLLARSWKNNEKVMFLGIGWMIAGLIPCMFGGIDRPGMICIEPHWVIFTLIGFCICLGDMVARIKNRAYAWGMCLLIIFFWFCLDRQYNVIWSNEKSYCYYWHGAFPSSQVPFYYLANVYQNEGDLDEAKRLYIETFKSPNYTKSFDYNVTMGVIEVEEHRWEQARIHLQEALAMDPDNSYVLTHLGIVAMYEKDNVKAKEYFNRAVKNRLEILGRLDFAALYEGEGNLQEAARLYQEILDIEPYDEISLVNLIQIYLHQGDRENILKIARILSKHSHNPVVLKNCDIIFQRYGK